MKKNNDWINKSISGKRGVVIRAVIIEEKLFLYFDDIVDAIQNTLIRANQSFEDGDLNEDMAWGAIMGACDIWGGLLEWKAKVER